MTETPLWFVFQGDRLLSRADGGSSIELSPDAPEDLGLREELYRRDVGALDGRRCFAVEVGIEEEAPEGMEFRDLRGLLGGVREELFRMAGRAKQVVEWNRTNQFCGRCGSVTEDVAGEFAKVCPVDGIVYYPRLSPAAIMLVERGDRLLLARSPGFPAGLYSTLAGFVEPGESIERTIEREVREEVGIEVSGVRYFGSQPWPFPNSLMVGFFAEYADGELRPDPSEIEDARWFAADDLPSIPPKVTIARSLIDDFLRRRGRSTDPETVHDLRPDA